MLVYACVCLTGMEVYRCRGAEGGEVVGGAANANTCAGVLCVSVCVRAGMCLHRVANSRSHPLPNRSLQPTLWHQDGWTPLCVAAGNGHTECVQALVEAGADKEKSDNVSFVFVGCA